jgi:hypothetical protein
MPNAGANRDLNTLIKATEDNRMILKKMQQKVESLKEDILALKSSRLEIDRKREMRNLK